MGSITEDEMSPESSPGRPNRPGVRRVNNVPIYIVVGALAIFLLIMVLVAVDRASKQNGPMRDVAAPKNGTTSMFAREIAGDRKDGIVQASSLATDLAPPDSIANARPAGLDVAPPSPGLLAAPNSQLQSGTQSEGAVRDDEATRIRITKLQQFDEAVKAKTSLSVSMPRSGAGQPAVPLSLPAAPASREDTLARLAAIRQQIDASTKDDPTAAYKARMQLIEGQGLEGGAATSTNAPRMALAAPGRELVLAGASGLGERWRLESKPEAPRSPYELRAGFVIPATLISGINSELPGQLMAQVSQDVYDTPIGRHRLIPQGSRLIGSYANDVAYGQSRILVVWQRIIFPDGKAMDIGAMPGADGAGYTGLNDQVNNHYARLFGSAFLMSGVTAGIALSQPETGNFNARPTASSALSEALGQQLGQVTAQLIAKNLNSAPTLEIRPGYRFNVIVVKDMTFSKPYVDFDY